MQKILVIETDLEVQRHICNVLEAPDYCVLIAADAPQGLRLLREESIDIVFVDLMILGTDSLQLFRELHYVRFTTKIIAMTDDIGVWPNQVTASYFGAQMFLHKPFSRQKLLEAVRDHIPS